jgi:hypothetical protein
MPRRGSELAHTPTATDALRAAASEFAGVDGLLTFRPDIRQYEAEALACQASDRYRSGEGDLEGISQDLRRRTPPRGRGGVIAPTPHRYWQATIPGPNRKTDAIAWTYAPANPGGPRVRLADLGGRAARDLYSCELVGCDELGPSALRRMLSVLADSARDILGLRGDDDSLAARWLVRLAELPATDDFRVQRYSLILRMPAPRPGIANISFGPAWEPYRAEAPKTDWWAARIPHVFRVSALAAERTTAPNPRPRRANAEHPRTAVKNKATKLFLQLRGEKGDKGAVKAVNGKLGTTYKLGTFRKYARQSRRGAK